MTSVGTRPACQQSLKGTEGEGMDLAGSRRRKQRTQHMHDALKTLSSFTLYARNQKLILHVARRQRPVEILARGTEADALSIFNREAL